MKIVKLKFRIRYQSHQICELRQSNRKLLSKVFRLKRTNKGKNNVKLNKSPKRISLGINAKYFLLR